MSVAHLGAWDVTLGSTPLRIIADPEKPDRGDVGYSGSYETQENQLRLERRDSTVIVGKSLRRGMGIGRRRSEDDEDGYFWGENVFTHFDDGARPAGRRQSYSLSGLSDGGAALNNLRFTHTAEFDTHLWWATDGGCVVLIPGGDPTQTPQYNPSLNAFGSATRSLRANYNAFQLMPFEDNAGASCLYLGATAPGVGSRMYERPAGGSWAESAAFASVRLERFAVCWWQDENGVGADRLHVRSSSSHEIRHCIKGSDPMLEASYVTPISIGTGDSQIQDLITAPQRLMVLKTNGLWDVTPFRAPHLTPTVSLNKNLNEHAATLLGRIPGYLYDDQIYFARGLAVSRYDLNLDGEQQRLDGDCSPWFNAHDGFPVRGYPTAFAEHAGALLMAVWNPDNLTSYVVRGFDAKKLGVSGRGPVIWHGAEVVLSPSGGVGRLITRMHVGSPSVSSGTALQSIKQYLWLGCLSSAGGAPTIDYVELPNAGGPLAQAISGGSFAHHPTATLVHTSQDWDDANAAKYLRRVDARSSKASSSNSIALLLRADGDPASATAGYSTEGTIDADSEKILPATIQGGRYIDTKLVWTTASPYTTAAVSHEIRLRAAVRRETFQVRYLWVILERDYELVLGQPDVRDPDAIFDTLAGLQDAGQQSFTDESLRLYQVLVEQGIQYSRQQVEIDGRNEYRTIARLELSIVSGPS